LVVVLSEQLFYKDLKLANLFDRGACQAWLNAGEPMSLVQVQSELVKASAVLESGLELAQQSFVLSVSEGLAQVSDTFSRLF